MKELIKKSESFVFELFKNKLPPSYIYHNFLHTQRVVESMEELIDHGTYTDNDQLVLLISSWFHDTGYIHGADDHETLSVIIARDFLQDKNISKTQIAQIEKCILATAYGRVPEGPLEEAMVDADNSHLAKKYYNQVSELLRQELTITEVADYNTKEWRDKNIEYFVTKHRFYTRYAVDNWTPKKNKQLVNLLEEDKKKRKLVKKEDLKARLKAKYKNESSERGIQTLFRVTLRNHIKLSDIADTKANILLSVNAIIISLALANLIPKLDSPNNHHLMIPSLILVLFSVASIILSIMSTQPKVTGGSFTKEQVRDRKVNLLFFGNFYKMSYEDYQWAIDEMIADKDTIYKMLTKDLYLLGLVLKKKYSLLKITYVVFTIGIISSVISFIVAFSQTEFRQLEQIMTP